jgi:hypothetical protein
MRMQEAFPTNLKRLVRAEMARSGMDLKHLCESYRINKKSLYAWMAGDSIPNLLKVYKLSKMCRCSIDDFLEGVTE